MFGIPSTAEAPSQKARQAAATRSQLLAVGRQLFAERGFAGTSTEEIVQQAQVTRGALYYHFRSKEDLFRAVFEAVEEDLNARVTAVATAAGEPWPALLAGCEAFQLTGHQNIVTVQARSPRRNGIALTLPDGELHDRGGVEVPDVQRSSARNSARASEAGRRVAQLRAKRTPSCRS